MGEEVMRKMKKSNTSLKNRSLAAAARRRTKLKNIFRKVNNRKRTHFKQVLFEQKISAA